MLTIFVDRVVGLLGILVVASVMIVIYLPSLLSIKSEFRPVQIAVILVGATSIGGITGAVALESPWNFIHHSWVAAFLSRGMEKIPESIASQFRRVIHGLNLYRRRRRTIGLTTLLSILVQCGLAVNLILIAKSLGNSWIPVKDYFLVVPVSSAIAAIPITPAGIGTRDAITAMFFCALQNTIGTIGAIPITMTLIIVFWGLIGGIIFMVSKIQKVDDRPE